MNMSWRISLSGLVGAGLFALTTMAAFQYSYGLILFVAAPLLAGCLSASVCSYGSAASLSDCLKYSMYPFYVSAVLLLLLRVEGLICLAMAAPLAIPLALLGGWIAFKAQRGLPPAAITGCFLILLPGGILVGPHGPSKQWFTVTTPMIVNAPPEVVWNRVVSFPDVAPPDNWLFRAGVAYPVRTGIQGSGPGAARQCVLSTGVMEEKVTAWDPPHLLRFSVNSTPPAMKELSPWKDLDAPHLHGYYVSREGQFRLTPLPGNRTLVEGTSTYRHGLEPAQYWRLWSDYVVHQVHGRVLRHVKQLAEQDYRERPVLVVAQNHGQAQ